MTRDDYEVEKLERLEDLDLDDNPNSVLTVRDPSGKVGYVAGPHGISCCCLSDWLEFVGDPDDSREHAIMVGCE